MAILLMTIAARFVAISKLENDRGWVRLLCSAKPSRNPQSKNASFTGVFLYSAGRIRTPKQQNRSDSPET
jgi:hypothetical protein